MLDCVSVPYSNYANLVSSVLDAREVWLVLDMLVQRYDEFGPSDRWFSCLSTQVSFLKQHLAIRKNPQEFTAPGGFFVFARKYLLPWLSSVYARAFFLSSLSCFLFSLGIY